MFLRCRSDAKLFGILALLSVFQLTNDRLRPNSCDRYWSGPDDGLSPTIVSRTQSHVHSASVTAAEHVHGAVRLDAVDAVRSQATCRICHWFATASGTLGSLLVESQRGHRTSRAGLRRAAHRKHPWEAHNAGCRDSEFRCKEIDRTSLETSESSVFDSLSRR